MRVSVHISGNSLCDLCGGVDVVTHSESARAFEIRTARQEFMSWQREYRDAKAKINKYRSPISRSVSWWFFNTARHNYLRSMAALRSALRAPKGE